MSRRRNRAFAALLAALLCAGCTHSHLRWNATHQARTVSDIYEQQALDNLAKFVHDIDAIPHFALASDGSASITDHGGIASTTTWDRVAFTGETIGLNAGRDAFEVWNLTAISDPRKLERMRCAYQQVVRACVAQCAKGPTGPCCPDCDKVLNAFYTGDPEKPAPAPGTDKFEGSVNNHCFGRRACWLAWGDKRDVPCCEACLKVGSYCGTYVWVLPGGEAELANLTLAILDYAKNSAPEAVEPSKEVTLFLDSHGDPVCQKDAVAIVRATIPANTPGLTLLEIERIKALKMRIEKLRSVQPKAALTASPELRRLEEELNSLQERKPTIPPLQPQRRSIPDGAGSVFKLQQELQQAAPQGR